VTDRSPNEWCSTRRIVRKESLLSELILASLLAGHLLCVNVASAGPLVSIWLDWREAGGDDLAGKAGRFLSWTATTLLILGSCLGLLLGVCLWSDDYRTLLEIFQRRVSFGIWEIVFSLFLMLLCSVWWHLRRHTSRGGRILRTMLQFLAGTNLLYHFPFLFVILSDISKGRTEAPAEAIGSAQFRQLIADGSVLARVTHIWLASFAVTGLVLIVFAIRTTTDSESARAGRWGGRLALLATVLQIPAGVWVLVQLPRAAQLGMLGGDPLASCLLLGSIMLTLVLLHSLSAVAFGEAHRRALVQSTSVMILIVFLMTAVLRRI
jgi:hypothetical protein